MRLKPLAIAMMVVSTSASVTLARPALAEESGSNSDTQAINRKFAAMQAEIDALRAEVATLKQQAKANDAGPAKVAAAKPAATPEAAPAASQDGDAVAQASSTAAGGDTGTATQEVAAADTATSHTQDTGITLGGAMRFQYSYEDYNKSNVRRIGDIDFDIFRLDLHGKVHGILLDAQWRWFQYMSAIQHAWVGYDFNDTSELQIGLARIPFGNQPYDSHSYFFSSNYYLGLEDTHAAGVEYVYAGDPWNVQLAFFKNDATGGVDGGGNRTHSYSYSVLGVRTPGEGIYDTPSHPAGAVDTLAARVARTFKPTSDLSVELGASGMYGGLDDPYARIGHYYAAALHTNINYKRWNFQAQAAHYDYTTDSDATRLAVGAYAFYDTIAARADSYTVNVAYHLPVAWGPIAGLDFYNDYSMVTHKSGGLPSTFMDVLGVGVSAGDLYTYLDFVTARNQPFIGGSMAGDGKVERRVNFNFGFYF